MNTKICLVLLVFLLMDATVAKKKGGGSSCKGKKKALCNKLETCEDKNTEQATEIEGLKASIEEQATEIEGLKASIEEQETEIEGLKAEIGEQATEIEKLKAENEELNEKIGEQATEIEELNAKIEELERERCYKSCKDAYDAGQREDKAYRIQLDSGVTDVYCHMSDIEGCGSGGFTLVMKIDGAQQNFLYDSDRWTNKEAYNVDAGTTGFDNQETKLPTYSETPFNKVCLGMSVEGAQNFISIDQEADSLYSLIADGQYRASNLGRETWKSLIADSSLQLNCNKEGFNAKATEGAARARIGISSNEQDDCNSNDSYIGFGTKGSVDPTTSCGNSAHFSPDNGEKNIEAFGYILVQ